MNKSKLVTGISLTAVTALALTVPSLAPQWSAAQTAPAPGPAATARADSPVQADTPRTATAAPASTGSTSTTTPSEALSRGVVLIASRTANGEGAGTGMVLTASGQVLTNYHVVQGSTALEVTIPDTGTTYSASVVGHDATRDVALLQLQGASGLDTITPDDDTVAIGDALTAVGNASGERQLVAASGQVTGLKQQVTVSGQYGQETLTGVIQTNAGAVPGDSGGPMFDAEGEVLGMTTAGGQEVASAPGGRARRGGVVTTVSYAVPIRDALAVVDQIRTGRDAGTVRVGAKAYLGITVGGSPDLIVSSVLEGSAAAEAGLTAGSQITAIDGRPVSAHDELADALRTVEPGERVALAWTDTHGVPHEATVRLGESPVN